MLSYILRRLILMVPTLLGVTAVVFFVMAFAPGGFSGQQLNPEGAQSEGEQSKIIRERFLKRYGLDKPPIVQYGRWLNQISPIGFPTDDQTGDVIFTVPQVKMPNLGLSLRGRPVSELLLEAVPITLLLNVITIPIIYLVAIVVGIFAARHRGKFFDISSGTLMVGLWSLPAIWVGLLFIGYLANREYLYLFPTAGLHDLRAADMPFFPVWTDAGWQRGWLLDMLWHLVLPIACLTYGGFAVLTKLTRGAVLENLASDYVRTARAKGLPERDVLFRHVFRNSLLPLITVAASILPSLLVGSVIVENIFSISGMGKLSVDAAFMKDREIIMGVTLIGGLIGLTSEILRDVLYAMADPRVSYE